MTFCDFASDWKFSCDMEAIEYNPEPGSSNSGMIPIPVMKDIDPSNKRSLDEVTNNEHPEDFEPKRPKTSDPESRKIYIGNLPSSVTEKPLVAKFRSFGHVVNCQVVRDRDTGISRGFAFLTFMDETEADCCVNYPDHTLDGKPIRGKYGFLVSIIVLP